MKVGFIGAGNMAGAIIRGMAANGFRGEDMLVYDTDGAKLAVTAANNNRSAFLQSGIGSTFCADFCNDGSWLSYRWKNISAKTAFFSDTRIPLAALKIKDTSGRSITWFNCFNTSQFAD